MLIQNHENTVPKDPEAIRNLKTMLEGYQRQTKAINDAIARKIKEQITPDDIKKLLEQLFDLKQMGPVLKKCYLGVFMKMFSFLYMHEMV